MKILLVLLLLAALAVSLTCCSRINDFLHPNRETTETRKPRETKTTTDSSETDSVNEAEPICEIPTVEGPPAEAFEKEIEEVIRETPVSNTPGAALDEVLLALADIKVLDRTEYTIRYEITAPDMAVVISNGGDDLLEKENGVEMIVDVLKTGGYPTTKKEVTVTVDAYGIPEEPFEFYDAVYGGLLTVLNERMDALGGER